MEDLLTTFPCVVGLKNKWKLLNFDVVSVILGLRGLKKWVDGLVP